MSKGKKKKNTSLGRSVNTFEGGMVKDLSEHLQDASSYRESFNGRLIFNEDNTYSWENIDGTEELLNIQIAYNCPGLNSRIDHLHIIGSCEFPDYVVLFIQVELLNEQVTYSEIGIIEKTDAPVVDTYSYKTLYYDGYDPFFDVSDSKTYTALLDFDKRHPIEAVAITENIQHERVYWTDDYNRPRVFDIRAVLDDSRAEADHPSIIGDWYSWVNQDCESYKYDPKYGFNSNQFAIQAEVNFGILKFYREITGNLSSGMYQYTYRYVSRSGYQSEWYPLSTPLHVCDRAKDTANNDWSNFFMQNVGENSGKGLEFEIKGVDESFDMIEFSYAYSETSIGPPSEFYIVGQVDVRREIYNANSYTYSQATGSGLGDQSSNVLKRIFFQHQVNGGGAIALEELPVSYLNIKKAKTVKTKGNRLFFGNIEEDPEVLLPDSVIQGGGNSPGITVSPIYKRMLGDEVARAWRPPLTHQDRRDGQIPVKLWDIPGTTYGHTEWHNVDDDWVNYKGIQSAHTNLGYWRGETYRFGIVFFTKTGQPLPVQHLVDFTFPEQYNGNYTYQTINNDGSLNPIQTGSIPVSTNGSINSDAPTLTSHVNHTMDASIESDAFTGSSLAMPSPLGLSNWNGTQSFGVSYLRIQGLKIDGIDISSVRDDISGYAIVRAPRDAKVIAQGVVAPAVQARYGENGSDNADPHTDPFAPGGNGCQVNNEEVMDNDGVMIPPISGTFFRRMPGNARDNQSIWYDKWSNNLMFMYTVKSHLPYSANDFNGGIASLRQLMWGYEYFPSYGSRANTKDKPRASQARFPFQNWYKSAGGNGVWGDINYNHNYVNEQTWVGIRAYPHWYYFGCPDFMHTTESKYDVFPWMKEAVLVETEPCEAPCDQTTGEWTTNEWEPPSGHTIKVVGKLQAAYKAAEIPSNNNSVTPTTHTNGGFFATSLMEMTNYGVAKTVSLPNSGGSKWDHVQAKFYTKHYFSFLLNHDSNGGPNERDRHEPSSSCYNSTSPYDWPRTAWEEDGSSGIHVSDSLGAVSYLNSQGFSNPTNGVDYAGSGAIDNPNDWNSNQLNNYHTYGRTSRIGGMIEAGAAACSTSRKYNTTVRNIPSELDNSFHPNGNGIVNNYAIFGWHTGTIQPVWLHHKDICNGVEDCDGCGKHAFRTWEEGYMPKVWYAPYAKLRSHGQTLRPAIGMSGDAWWKAWSMDPGRNGSKDNCNFKDEDASGATSSFSSSGATVILRSGIGHKHALYLRLQDWKYLFSCSKESHTATSSREGHHMDVWHVVNYTQDTKVPYGGLNTLSLNKFPYQFTGTYIPVNEDTWNTPDIINGTEVWGGDCFLVHYDWSRIHPHIKGNAANLFYSICENGDDNMCSGDALDGFIDFYGHQSSGNGLQCSNDVCQHSETSYGVGMMIPVESNFNLELRNNADKFSSVGHKTESDYHFNHEPYKSRGLFFGYRCSNGSLGTNFFRYQTFEIADCLQYEESIRLYTTAEKIIMNAKTPYDFPTRWIWSGYKNYGEQIDSFRQFPVGQFHDLDGSYGEVMGSATLFDEIFSLQEDAVGKLRVDERAVIPDEMGAEIIVGNPNVMTGIDYVSTNSGTQHQWSIAASDLSFYYVDAKRESITRYTGKGVESISNSRGIHSHIKPISSFFYNTYIPNEGVDSPTAFADIPTSGIHTVFDKEHGDVYFSFMSIYFRRTIIFNEYIDKFTGEISVVPPIFFKFGNLLMSTDRGYYNDTLGNNLSDNTSGVTISGYNRGNKCQFFNRYHRSALVFISNDAPIYSKTFDNLIFNINNFVSLLESLTLTTEFNSHRLTAVSTDDRARYRESLFKIPARELGRADRVRGKRMEVRMLMDNDGQRQNIHSVETLYRPSRRL